MKLNKTLIAALVLGIGLTGCDNMVDNGNGEKNNDDNTPVVEENQDETKNTADTENEETAKDDDEEKVETEPDEDETDKDSTDNDVKKSGENEDSSSEEKSTGKKSKEEQIEALEQAIFDNRSSARAIELLFQLSPEIAKENEDELNGLLEESNELLVEAQIVLDELKSE